MPTYLVSVKSDGDKLSPDYTETLLLTSDLFKRLLQKSKVTDG
jgi:hypothetical protein